MPSFANRIFRNTDSRRGRQALGPFPGRQMTLTKADIVRRVREEVRLRNRRKSRQRFLFPEMDCVFLSREQAAHIVNSLFEIVKEALVRGEDVRVSGFGKFQTRFKWARKGRNPRTGEMIILRSRRTVTFKASAKLKQKVNASGPGRGESPDPVQGKIS